MLQRAARAPVRFFQLGLVPLGVDDSFAVIVTALFSSVPGNLFEAQLVLQACQVLLSRGLFSEHVLHGCRTSPSCDSSAA